MNGWVGVDLDGTLAVHPHHYIPGVIGDPIPLMVQRVKAWLEEGVDVRLFTARAGTSDPDIEYPAIRAWCLEHIGQELEITNMKDYTTIQIWDDRAVGVEQNTGRVVSMGGGA